MSITSRTFLAALFFVMFVQRTALAQATFTSTSAKVSTLGWYEGSLFVKWSESGLSPNAAVSYTITGTSRAIYACSKGGTGTMCQASSSASPADLLAITMTSSSSGSIRQSVAVPPPGAGSCTCASGNLVLYQVSYGNNATAPDLQICDDTTSTAVCASVGSGYFSQTFCKASSLQNCPPAP
jgi:hypothetical protein